MLFKNSVRTSKRTPHFDKEQLLNAVLRVQSLFIVITTQNI